MVLVVENGTGLSNANAYVSVAFVDAYATLHNSATWQGNAAQKEAAIIQATQYIDAKYSFDGSILVTAQSLAFPRTNIYDKEGRTLSGVPKLIQEACCEFAFVAHDKPLVISPETPIVSRKKIKAGSVETETEYVANGGTNNSYSVCPRGEMLLVDLLKNQSSPNGGFIRFGKG